MDVHGSNGEHHVTGQVILSLPGHACMRCMGFPNREVLAKAQAYSAGKPRCLPNGVLASTAVGHLISLLTPWHPDLAPSQYLEYDGNRFTVNPSPKLAYIDKVSCAYTSQERMPWATYLGSKVRAFNDKRPVKPGVITSRMHRFFHYLRHQFFTNLARFSLSVSPDRCD